MLTSTLACSVGGIVGRFVVVVCEIVVFGCAFVVFDAAGVVSPVCSFPFVERAVVFPSDCLPPSVFPNVVVDCTIVVSDGVTGVDPK